MNKTATPPNSDWLEKMHHDRLVNFLKNAIAIPVAQLRYVDLYTSLGCHGIYGFFAGDKYQVVDSNTGEPIGCWYIGSANSKALVERIGCHFAPRYMDFGNSLIKRIAYTVASDTDKSLFNVKDPSPQQEQRMNEIIEKCFPILQSLQLKFFFYDEAGDEELRDNIRADEKVLIKHFQPAFNNPKRSRPQLEIHDGKGRIVQY